MGDEHLHLDLVRQGQFERRLDDRAQVGAEVRLGLHPLDLRAADLQRQHAGRVDDLLREVDLEMPHHLAALLAPTLDGGILRILDQFAAAFEDLVERPAAPAVEHLDRRVHLGSSLFFICTGPRRS
jgi:hypothetical protein